MSFDIIDQMIEPSRKGVLMRGLIKRAFFVVALVLACGVLPVASWAEGAADQAVGGVPVAGDIVFGLDSEDEFVRDSSSSLNSLASSSCYAVLYDGDSDGVGETLVFQDTASSLPGYGLKKESWSFSTDKSYNSVSPVPWYRYNKDDIVFVRFDCTVVPTSMSYWFYDLPKLQAVAFGPLDTSQTTSMWGLFYGCSSLEQIDLSGLNMQNVTDMGRMFQDCASLKSIDLSVLDLPKVEDASNIFSGCTSLLAFNLNASNFSPKYCSEIFRGCSSLAYAELPSWGRGVPYGMFDGCSSLEWVSLPAGENYVSNNAFNNCSSLTDVYFGGSSIDVEVSPTYNDAFKKATWHSYHIHSRYKDTAGEPTCLTSGFTGYVCRFGETLVERRIPAKGHEFSDTPIAVSAPTCTSKGRNFYVCNSCGTQEIRNDIPALEHNVQDVSARVATCTEPGNSEGTRCSECGEWFIGGVTDGPLGHSFENGSCTRCGRSGDYGGSCGDELFWSLDVETGVLSIYGSGKMNGYGTSEIDGAVVTSAPWGRYASLITRVEISEGATSVGGYAFVGCSQIISVDIAETVTSIYSYAFDHCSKITAINIPGVEYIGECAFRRCSSLESITIPAPVYSIGDSAFRQCFSLKSVTFLSGLWRKYIDEYAFAACTSLMSVEIPYGVEKIESNTFMGCSKLAAVSIPASVAIIEDGAFGACSALSSVSFADNSRCNRIHTFAFHKCTSLEKVFIPASVKTIDTGAFEECTSLADVYTGHSSKDEITIGNQYGDYNEYLVNATWHYSHVHVLDRAQTHDPTCVDGGYALGQCVCGMQARIYPEPALGHDAQIVEASEATCVSPSHSAGECCSRCNQWLVEVQTSPALGHDFGGVGCVRCGAGDVNENEVVNIVDAQIAYDVARGHCDAFEHYDKLVALSDVTADCRVDACDAFAIQYRVMRGSWGI